jgi:hypothetical protein
MQNHIINDWVGRQTTYPIDLEMIIFNTAMLSTSALKGFQSGQDTICARVNPRG